MRESGAEHRQLLRDGVLGDSGPATARDEGVDGRSVVQLRRLHVVTSGSTYTTWQRELYQRERDGRSFEADVTSQRVECPLTFRDERDGGADD